MKKEFLYDMTVLVHDGMHARDMLNEEYALDVSVSPNADLDGKIYVAYCHDEDEYITIDAYAFEWELAQ